MITLLDEHAVHQTTEPLARPATSERNFYDRWFFAGYADDGRYVFEAALGLYPNRRVMDAHFSVLADGVQHCFHASRRAPLERTETTVGPFALRIEQPLRVLHLGTLFWGVACIAFALVMTMKIGPTIDFGWKVGGLLGGGMLGLFLLGLMTKASSGAAAIGVVVGVLLILWMTLSKMPIWPAAWKSFVSPYHDLTIPVAGTLAVIIVGWALGWVGRGREAVPAEPEQA